MLYRKGQTLFNEIQSQPKAWQEVLQTLAAQRDTAADWIKGQGFGQVVYIAAGELLAVAQSAARVTHLVSGLNSIACAPTELMYGRRAPYDVRIKTLVIVFSRPAVSEETGWGIEKLKACDPRAQFLILETETSELSAHGQLNFLFNGIKDATKTAVSSATSLLMASFAILSWLTGKEVLWKEMEKLPSIMDGQIKTWQSKAQQIVQSKPSHIVFLGSGPFRGAASLGALMMSKISGLTCESDYFLEYRHGAYGSLTNQTMVIGLISNTFRGAEEKTLGDLAVMRANRIAVAEDAGALAKLCDNVMELKSGVSEIARVLLAIPIMQLLTFYQAMQRGVNPDNPKHLDHPALVLKERPGMK